MLQRFLKLALLTLLAYLLQSTVSAHIQIGDVGPNIALSLIAVVSVSEGRKYTYIMSMIVGYLMEIMAGPVDYLYMLLYPICSMLGALAFSDKSERKLEEERSMGKRGGNLPAHLRTPLCALVSVSVFEFVNVFYIYLNGVALDMGHIGRALIDIVYTSLLAGVVQFPLRWWLGVYKRKKAR